ncbi:MAG: hypothetical protein PHR35_12360 [Kiritimatiellae bacterium]|nr:hypothetical protein [Kiritimatiellia bacterium]
MANASPWRTCRLALLALVLSVAPAFAEEARTALTIYNQPREEILVQPGSGVAGLGRVVQDPSARTGWAICADPADRPGAGYLLYGYAYNQGPGVIRVTYRLKVADNTCSQAVAAVQVNIWDNDLRQDPNRMEFIRGIAFRATNTYQDFKFDIAKGEAGFVGWGVQTLGVTSLSWDGVTVEQLTRFTTGELLALVKTPERPENLTPAREPFRVHETYGLYMPLWRGRAATALLGAEYTQSTLKVHPQQTRLTGFPAAWKELYAHAVVALNNAPAKAVGVVGCLMLKQYVEDGGCVILMGDTHSLAAGQWAESALGPLLPVTLEGPRDVTLPDRPLLLEPRVETLRAFDWAAKPYTVYYHKATVRPGARVLLAAGEIPLIIEGSAGKGRIMVVLASVLGDSDPKAEGMPFWEWPDWPALMARLLCPNGNGK